MKSLKLDWECEFIGGHQDGRRMKFCGFENVPKVVVIDTDNTTDWYVRRYIAQPLLDENGDLVDIDHDTVLVLESIAIAHPDKYQNLT